MSSSSSIPSRPPAPAREIAVPTSHGYQAQAVRAYLSDRPLLAAGARAAALLALLFALIALPIALAAVVEFEMIASARGQITASGAIATASVASADCAALRAGQGVRVELDRPLAAGPDGPVNLAGVIT